MPRLILLVALAAVAVGCAPAGLNYQALETHLAQDNCMAATDYMAGSGETYGENQRLIYLMDAGMVNLYCLNSDQAGQLFSEADDLAQDLWTKSISDEALSMVTNDYSVAYAGEDFERVMINLFASIGYSTASNFESALVEARRMNSKLGEINAEYDEGSSVYREDAFGRYMSGMLYEAENSRSMENLDEAFIDYAKAYKAYLTYTDNYGTPVPRVFMEDYLRLAEATGRMSEVGNPGGITWTPQKQARGMGRIVMIHLNGKSPMKVEESFVLDLGNGQFSKVAFPKYAPSAPMCPMSTMNVEAGGAVVATASADLVEDIGNIAVKNLDDRWVRFKVKAIARAALKAVAVNAAAEQIDNPLLRFAAKLGGSALAAATEVADVRSWRTLPNQVNLARSFVMPGTYRVTANYCGRMITVSDSVQVAAGQTRILLLKTVY